MAFGFRPLAAKPLASGSGVVAVAGDQALTQATSFTETDTFFTPAATVTRGAVDLSQTTSFAADDVFQTPTVGRGAVGLTQTARFDEADTFFSPAATVTRGAVNLSQTTRFDEADGFFTQTVVSTYVLVQTALVLEFSTVVSPANMTTNTAPSPYVASASSEAA